MWLACLDDFWCFIFSRQLSSLRFTSTRAWIVRQIFSRWIQCHPSSYRQSTSLNLNRLSGFGVAGVVPTSHFENHLRSDVFVEVSLITEPKLKTTKRDFKRSSESEINIHNDGDNILNFSSYLEEIRIQSQDTRIISVHTMSEKQFGKKRKSMEK